MEYLIDYELHENRILNVKKIQKYIKSQVKHSVQFLIFSFDGIGSIATSALFNDGEQLQINGNLKPSIEELSNLSKDIINNLILLNYFWINCLLFFNSEFTSVLIVGKNTFTPHVGRWVSFH